MVCAVSAAPADYVTYVNSNLNHGFPYGFGTRTSAGHYPIPILQSVPSLPVQTYLPPSPTIYSSPQPSPLLITQTQPTRKSFDIQPAPFVYLALAMSGTS